MIKISNNTRSRQLVEKLLDSETTLGYVCDPEIQWIIDITRWNFGCMTIYETNRDGNVLSIGDAHYGYQDNARTIINRGHSNAVSINPPQPISAYLTLPENY